MKPILMRAMPLIFFGRAMSLMPCQLAGLEGPHSKGSSPSGCVGLSSSVCDKDTAYWDKTTGKCVPLATLCGEGTEFVNGKCTVAGAKK